MKFESYFDWLNENELVSKPTYGCVMLYATVPNWDKHLSMIDVEDIYGVPGKALEHTPHCTLLYGIYTDKTKPEEIKEIMKTFFPLQVTIKEISMFETAECDVVKYTVPNKKELKVWREELMKFPNYQEFPDYKPHMTIAYVNKGSAFKYVKQLQDGFKIMFNKAVYSYTENEKDNIVVQLDKT